MEERKEDTSGFVKRGVGAFSHLLEKGGAIYHEKGRGGEVRLEKRGRVIITRKDSFQKRIQFAIDWGKGKESRSGPRREGKGQDAAL